jgi:hypothetical protein
MGKWNAFGPAVDWGIKQTPLKNINHLLHEHDEKGMWKGKIENRRKAKRRQINAIIKC